MIFLLAVVAGCQLNVRPTDDELRQSGIVVDRYDRVESTFLTMSDFASLHQMRSDYPVQTRTLVEDMLQLGPVTAPDMSRRMLHFYQDSTLRAIISDVGRQYNDIDDIQQQLSSSFHRLGHLFPAMPMPHVYTQIGALAQSIVVTDTLLGISLDKYLGSDYPVYLHYGYTANQRRMMTRQYIVPDCIGFYLLSLYPMPEQADSVPALRRWHMQKIQCIVNEAMTRKVFESDTISRLEHFRMQHPHLSASEFLLLDSLAN